MIKKIFVPYDNTYIEISLPEKNIAYLNDNPDYSDIDNNSSWIPDAVLARLATKKNVLVLMADATRDIPFQQIMDHFFSSMGNLPKSVRFCLATGTHEGDKKENYEILDYSRHCANKYHIPLKDSTIHSCYTSPLFYAGSTSFGNDVYVNTIVRNTDLILIHADMKNHYFAGYSNPIKYIIPGICGFKTIERNHALALDIRSTFGHHPLHPDIQRRNNPLAKDMWEGFQLVTKNIPVYVLLTVSSNRNIHWKKSGFLTDVLPEGMQIVDKRMGLTVKPHNKLIVSCGGYPNDESLYIAQRALELTKNALLIKGEILFIAACRNGIGPVKALENFYNPLKFDLPLLIEKYKDNYKMYTHKVYKFAQLIDRTRSIYMHSMLNDKQISDIHLKPIKDIQNIINQWIATDINCKINIFLDGNKTAVYPV